jgi:NAD(P)-dependent dehydrogenase (short-subunit alcohol dehydrogenase family)
VECEEAGAEALVVPTDVRDAAAVDRLLEAAVTRFGRVDGVVHAAAVLAYGRFEEVPADVFARIQQTNILGTANVSRSALEVFRRQEQGRLVVMGSVVGKMAVPLMSTYVTSKWAVHGLVRTLQIEARRTPGIDITLISPGGVDTPIYLLAGNYTGSGGRPPPPVDSPEKVARAVVRALDKPQREASVGLANPLMVTGFRLLPGVYDLLVTPLLERVALSRTPVAGGPGNVLEPKPEDERVHGNWGSPLRSAADALAGVAAPAATWLWSRGRAAADRPSE